MDAQEGAVRRIVGGVDTHKDLHVAAALVLGSLPLFLGLIFVMPVLGHATWHLYRRIVGPE